MKSLYGLKIDKGPVSLTRETAVPCIGHITATLDVTAETIDTGDALSTFNELIKDIKMKVEFIANKDGVDINLLDWSQ